MGSITTDAHPTMVSLTSPTFAMNVTRGTIQIPFVNTLVTSDSVRAVSREIVPTSFALKGLSDWESIPNPPPLAASAT